MIAAGTKLGRYEIRSQLGAGGMGEVYLAQDTKLDRKVALKILPADVAAHPDRMLSTLTLILILNISRTESPITLSRGCRSFLT